MENSPEILVAGIKERDIDLMLVDELVSTPRFVTWFVAQTLGESNVWTVAKAARSVTQSQGESDVELWLDGDAGSLILLIENKITAALERTQAQRYRQRAANYRRRRDCLRAATVLIAPQNYFSPTVSAEFDHTLCYEQLRQWFQDAAKEGLIERGRAAYRLAMLDKAIIKRQLGYQPVDDAPVTNFWQQYWQLQQSLAPELCMNKPGARPAKSRFFFFLPPGLPEGGRIVHKSLQGRVDLQFPHMADRLEQMQQRFGDLLEPGMLIARAGKAAVIRLPAPRLDTGQPFAEQRHLVEQALGLAQHLLGWWRTQGQARWQGPLRT